jgi:hypothetical protein
VNGSGGMWTADFNLQEAKPLPLHRPEARRSYCDDEAEQTASRKPEAETKYSDY